MSYLKSALSFVTSIFAPAAVALTLTSPDFKHSGNIPQEFTCHGEDLTPTLNWTGAPKGTKSFVLIMEDPDAPNGTWIHWVVYNIPASAHTLGKNSNSGIGGLNTWNKTTYGGPCPPSGVHHYIFNFHALDTMLDLQEPASLSDVKNAMKDHILESTQLIGLYSAKK